MQFFTQTKNFIRAFSQHLWLLIPLIITQLLQKLQDLVDDRFMNQLGASALTIHNVQYSFYGLSQEIGLIAATSLLVFWKRQEMQSKQKTILLLHTLLIFILSGTVCWFTLKNTAEICSHFSIASDHMGTAQQYLHIGLFLLFFRSLYVPINTVLIVCQQRLKSIIMIFSLISFKFILAQITRYFFWSQDPEIIATPMIIYSIGSILFSYGILFYGIHSAFKLAKGWGIFNFFQTLKVWPAEIGIGAVSAACPLIFTFQIAKANTYPGFFVTYQIALHLTCLLTLPVLAGIQIAIQEASSEHSRVEPQSALIGIKSLRHSKWWPPFLLASLLPTITGLAVTAVIPSKIIGWIYGYEVPQEHLDFLPLFFMAWILFQIGSIFLIVLRASQNNHIATRNIMISGFLVQLGFTQVLLWLGICTSLGIGIAVVISCFCFLILNWKSVTTLTRIAQSR